MASRGATVDLYDAFEDDDSIVEYYARKFTRDQLNRYSDLIGIEIPGDRKEDDCRRLLEENGWETYYQYSTKLNRIGPKTIVEGIRKLDRERLRNLSDEEMGDKVSLVLYLIEWEWEEEVELIRALREFKNKRTYERKKIEGKRVYEELTDEVTATIEEEIRDVLPEINDHQRLKTAFNRVDILDNRTLIVRFYAESRSSSFRQFSFRETKHSEFNGSENAELKHHDYWPVDTEHIYIDYERNEYYVDVRRSAEQLLTPVIETLYDEATYGDNVQFADPFDSDTDQTPDEFVSERVDQYRDSLDEDELLDEQKKDDYREILDELEAIEQTRIQLEQVNVEGNPQTLVIDTEQDISDFLEAHNLVDRVETFNEKSQNREYTIQLGDHEVDISGTEITITGDVSEDEERVLTALLREEGDGV